MFPFQIPGFDEEELPAMMFNTPQAAPAPVAGAYTNPLRQAEEDQLSKVLASLKAEQLQGIQKGYQQPELSESQVFTTAVASLLPIVAGYMLNKEKGGAVGAQAGGLIGQGVFQGLEQERKLEAEKQKLLNEARKDELKDTRAELKDVRKAGMQAEDQFALEGVKQKGDIELQNDKQKFTKAQDEFKEAGKNARAGDRETKANEIASRPYNIKTDEEQGNVSKLIVSSRGVIELAKKLDPERKESVAGAYARALKSGIFKSSEEADLTRQNMVNIFNSLKTFFPGAISDQEREAALKALGGDSGVPLWKVSDILKRGVSNAIAISNENLQRRKKAGYKINFEPITDPYAQPVTPGGGDMESRIQAKMREIAAREAAGK